MKKLLVLSVLLAGGLALTNNAIASNNQSSNTHKSVATCSQQHATLSVKGSCPLCKTRIEKAAKSLGGVSEASWSMKAQQLKLVFNPAKVTKNAIAKAIAEAGNDNALYKADDKVYNALPDCCHYRE